MVPTLGVFAAILDDRNQILLVERNYGPNNWTTPGGRADPGESPLDALVREVEEETGYRISPGHLIGVYAAPFKDDLVLFFAATVEDKNPRVPGPEISEMRYFPRDALPPMRRRTLVRVQDAFDGVTGVIRVFAHDDID